MKIVLCGTTKFKDAFLHWERELSIAGHVVLSVPCFEHADGLRFDEKDEATLVRVHKQKIDMSDVVLVVDTPFTNLLEIEENNYPNGEYPYTGEHTKAEIEYAKHQGKKIYFTSRGGGTTFTKFVKG